MDARDEPGRRRMPHLPPKELPNQTVIIYVTQVVQHRRPLLTRRPAIETLLAAWRRADHWQVGRYVVMPDHLHFFCAPARMPFVPITKWMAFWRSSVSRSWPWPEEKPVWQKDYFDRQLRHGESYAEKWSYLRENPVRSGLVSAADHWPWQGQQHALMWHEAD